MDLKYQFLATNRERQCVILFPKIIDIQLYSGLVHTPILYYLFLHGDMQSYVRAGKVWQIISFLRKWGPFNASHFGRVSSPECAPMIIFSLAFKYFLHWTTTSLRIVVWKTYLLLNSGQALAPAKPDGVYLHYLVCQLVSWASHSLAQYWNKLQTCFIQFWKGGRQDMKMQQSKMFF